MIESLLTFTSGYLSLMMISTTISIAALGVLSIIDERSYRIRTTIMVLPLFGGLIGELWQGVACFVHLSSIGVESVEHLLCNIITSTSMQSNCTAWVMAIGVSLSMTGLVLYLNNHFSTSIIDRFSDYTFLSKTEAKQLHERLDQFAQNAGIEKPKLSLIESSKPSIFSIGWGNNATIGLSVGLLETLSDEEVLACLAHEVAHCKNQDSRLKALISSLRFSSLFNPLGLLLGNKLNREMEYIADSEAAKLTGDSHYLISALINLSSPSDTISASHSKSPTKLYNRIKTMISIFLSKHPPPDERINRLLK